MLRAGQPRPAVVLALLGLVLATAMAATTALLRRPNQPAALAPPPASDAPSADLPVFFEPAPAGGFVSRGPGYSLALTGSDAVVGVRGGTFRLRPAGPTADPHAELVAGRPLGGTVNRLSGDDPAGWATRLTTYGRVEARQVWPGVDVVWHGGQGLLEHDMVVAPGADPALVAFDVEGADDLVLDPGGDLLIGLGGTAARLARPVVYQEVEGARRHVPGQFALLGPARIGFRVGAYDRSLPLVIDPTLVTSTFLGGIGNDSGYAVAVDAEGNRYVTGATESADFPTNAPLQSALQGAAPTSDAFVSKFSADGTRLIWSTYLGGQGRDTGYAVAVATDGTVLVAGVTESADFPRARGAQENFAGGASDGFVAKIAANGTGIEWSTFIGGTQTDRARGLAVDPGGNAYVTGSTASVDFPSVSAFNPGPFRPDDLDAFLVKVPATGGPFAYATRLGGSNDDRGLAVAVDGQANAYVTGDTLSPGFPTVRPIQATSGGSAGGVAGSFPDAFVSKFNPTGSALVYSTFLGGGDVDQGTAIAVDAQGAAYVAGNTNSPNFPTVAPLQPRKDNDSDAFVAKVDAPGGALVYSTYVGGGGADGANGVAVDRTGSAHVVGTTGSPNWPTSRPTQPARGGGDDAFVLKLSADGRTSVFSTYLGGRDADSGLGVAVGTQGAVHVLGLSGSADFPSVKPVQGSRPAAGGDAFVASLDVADLAAPATTTTSAGAPAAAPPASSAAAASSTSAHDRRVRILGAVTLALLLAAVAQTVYLRRRKPVTRPSRPQTAPRPSTGSASAGLRVLDSGSGATRKSGAPAKAAASKSTRSPKARGGPKGGAKKSGAGKGPAKKSGAPAKQGAAAAAAAAGALGGTAAASDAADGGPPTEAIPATPPRVRPHTPAVARLLEEDLWPPEPDEDELEEAAPASADALSDEWPEQAAPADEPSPAPAPTAVEDAIVEPAPAAPAAPVASPPPPPFAPPAPPSPAPGAPPEPAPAIPPVPAEELSFWDLFPEDLPPVRATNDPVDDLLVDPLALPEGPDSAVGHLIGSTEPRPRPEEESEGADPTRPRPPEAEIVIAELLDGPVPTGLRPAAESPWAPVPADGGFVISELLDDQADETATPPSRGSGAEASDGNGTDTVGAAAGGPSKAEQARIAADRARRRRSRRGGRGKPPGGST